MMTSYLLGFCRIVILTTFSVSFTNKIIDIGGFEQAIIRFNILPKSLSKVFAVFFTIVEMLIVTFALIGDGLLENAFILCIIILTVFSIALIHVLVKKNHTNCNCFSSKASPVSVSDIYRNCTLISIAILGLIIAFSSGSNNLDVLDWLVIACFGFVFTIVLIQLNQIIKLFLF